MVDGYQPKTGDTQPCLKCGNDRCTDCGELLRYKEFVHLAEAEDICVKCMEPSTA